MIESAKMEESSKETTVVSNEIMKPVPKPFSIEALMSDTGPKRTTSHHQHQWTDATVYCNSFTHQVSRDTDSEGSLDLDLAQDLSRRSQKDGNFF